MVGEFAVDASLRHRQGVAGGKFPDPRPRPAPRSPRGVMGSCRRSVVDPDVILLLGGIVRRSGSKVGSRYRALLASTTLPTA